MLKKLKTADNSSESRFETFQTNGIFISIILLISLAVYSNALFNGFVFDDRTQVLENTLIKDIKNIPEILTTDVWSFRGKLLSTKYYRPIVNILYMFNYHVSGLKPWGFHLNNILFHTGVSILVYVIIKGLLRRPTQSTNTSIPAFMAALLFAAHPVHTEAVVLISAVAEPAYTFFFLLSFHLYMRAREGGRRAYMFSVVSFALATLCKEPALTLPIFLVAYDYVYRKEADRLPDYIKRYIPYLIVSSCYLLIRYYALEGFSPLKSNIQLTGYEYFINIFPLFSQYLEKLLLPINLNAFYVFHPISSIFEMRGWVSVAITAAFVVFSVIVLKRRKTVFLGFLLIAVPLLPVLYMYPSLIFAERYLYLPSFGFVILIASVLSWIQANKSKLGLGLNIITILVIGLYSFGTISRNAVWKDDYTLFFDMVKKSPDSPFAHNNLGNIYAYQGKTDEAINEYQTALKLEPYFANTHYNLGCAYAKKGQVDEAIREFKTALLINPDDTTARQKLEFLLKK